MDFGHIIFILLIKSSSIVCENKEHKLCGFLVIQDFCGFDSTICWVDCKAAETKKSDWELDFFSELIEREYEKMNLLIVHLL